MRGEGDEAKVDAGDTEGGKEARWRMRGGGGGRVRVRGREDSSQLSDEEGPLRCSRDAKDDDVDSAGWHHRIVTLPIQIIITMMT